jgi:hypothetical protein
MTSQLSGLKAINDFFSILEAKLDPFVPLINRTISGFFVRGRENNLINIDYSRTQNCRDDPD